MTGALQSYTEYKDSCLPWLGRIPKHWDCLPHRALFEEIKEQGHVDEPLLSVTIGRGIIRQDELLAGSSKKDSSNLDKSKYKLAEPGDIAYNKMRAWQGAVGVSKYRGIVSPAYIVQRVRDGLRPAYFHYLFRTPGFAKEAERWSYGITSDQWSLRSQHFKMIYSCVPPLDEQDAIIRFLYDLDRKVQHFISNRRRLIDVLNEQKQAIINRAVTRGLDPDVPLKPSGIDWLKDIPQHWQVVQLRRRWRVTDCKHLTVPFTHEGIPLASVREVQSFDLNLTNCKRTTREWYESLIEGDRALRPGDLIYCRNVSVGACACVNSADELAMGQDVCLIRSQSENQRFLNYFLHSGAMKQQLAKVLVGSTFNRINVSEIKSLLVVLPPRDEQDSIAEYLDTELGDFHRPLENAQREIDLIREYRTRLIVDVVTGKVDVRHLAPLPGSEDLVEMVEELESLDDAACELNEEALAGEVAHADN